MEPARNGADPLVVNNIIGQIKSKGIFDQFRRDCLADVDTKPAYQNLRQRVEGYVSNYLGQHKWEPGMNKNQLRDSLRGQINQSEMLATGVERIIEQVVEPKIQHIFRPQIEKLVKETLNPNYKAESSNDNDNTENKTDIVAPPPEAPPPDLPSAALPPPPPPEEEDDGGDDMDISTPSPTSSPDIHLDSPVEEEEYHVQSPPPIPGIETDDAVDFVIGGQTIETSEVPITIELETSSDLPPEEMPTDPRLQLSPSPSPKADEMESEAIVEEEVVTGDTVEEVADDATLIKQTEQMQVDDDDVKTNNDVPSEGKSPKPDNDKDDNLIIAEESAGSKVKKRDQGADSDGESGLSDITVSSVHTSDLSSFDEDISSSSSSEESESDQSSESSFSDKLSDDSKKGVSRQKSPRKSQQGEVVEMPYRNVKLAHRGKGWFLDKYIYVKNRENSEKIFLRCQHKYLCKAIAYIDKATDKAYVKPGNHVHPPPDVRKINFGSDSDSKKGKKDKSKKGGDSSPKGDRKVAPIKLSVPKSASPQSAKEEEDVSKKEEPSQKDEDEDKSQPSTSAAVPSRIELTPEQRKAEAERWAAYYEYSIVPDMPERRSSTKALALSRYHSDSEDEDTREERRKKAALDKEERACRRQERRDSGMIPIPTRRSSQARKEERNDNQKGTDEKHRHPPESPVKATKAQLKEQKILEKKRGMRRQRSLNKKYFSEDFSSPVQENLKESLKVEEGSAASSEIKALSPIKRRAPEKIKPVIVSFHLRFRERRHAQVESHFLLCSCLSGEQQKKMSSRQQKSRKAGKKQAKFSFISKMAGDKMDAKKAPQQQAQRGRPKKIEEEGVGSDVSEEEGVGSDVSRSSTPVQDEIPMETTKEEKPKRGRGRPRKVDEQGQDQSRSSTPVQDEMATMVYGIASGSTEVKEEPLRRTRRRPRKYGDDDQEETSRPSTPVQDIAAAGGAEPGAPGSAQRRRGRPRKTPLEEMHAEGQMPVEEQKPVGEAKPLEEQRVVVEEKVDDYSRSSTPVQDEHILEDMEIDHGASSVLSNVVVQSEQVLAQNEQVVTEMQQTVSQSLVHSEPVVESQPSALASEPPVAQPPDVLQSEPPVTVPQQDTTSIQAEQPVAQQEQDITQSENIEPAEEMEVGETSGAEEATVVEKPSQDSEVAKEEVERMDEVPVSENDTKEQDTKPTTVTNVAKDDRGPSVKPKVTRNFLEALAMKTDFIIDSSSGSKEEEQEAGEGDQMLEKDDNVGSLVDKSVTQEKKPEEEKLSHSTAETEEVEKVSVGEIESGDKVGEKLEEEKMSQGAAEVEDVTKVSKEEIESGDKVDSSSIVIPGASDEKPPTEDEQNPEGIQTEAAMETEEIELENSDKDSKEDMTKDKVVSEEGILDETTEGESEKDLEKTVVSSEEPTVASKGTPDKDSPTDDTADEKALVMDSAETKQEEVPRPVLGHSPTPEDEVKEEDEQQDGKEVSAEKTADAEKTVEDTPVDTSEEFTLPALGSSPTAKVEEETDMEETTRSEEKDKKVETKESDKKEEEKEEESLVIPALGNSPTQTSNDDEKDDDEKKEVEPSDIEDNPPTPTQDEPSSMDEISTKEPDDDDEKPAIPIYSMSSPSKSPLGGLFVNRSVSQEGPSALSSVQSSPAAARSVAGESSGAETNVDSEESAPSVSRETRQRPKRRVSAAQDADFEYSHPKRLRGSETPPPPVLESELPIERPEETKTRTARASKQRHISPPRQPAAKESGVRTRHQSSQSTETQQSTRTPSPVPEQRVTRGRRLSHQSEDKQSHHYSDMVYYDTGRRSQRQQATTPPAAPARRSTRRSTDDKSSEKPTRAKRKR